MAVVAHQQVHPQTGMTRNSMSKQEILLLLFIGEVSIIPYRDQILPLPLFPVARVNSAGRNMACFSGAAPSEWQFLLDSLGFFRPWGWLGEEGVTEASFGTASLAMLQTRSSSGEACISQGLLSPLACEWLLAFSLRLAFPSLGMPSAATKRFWDEAQGKIFYLYQS